MATATKNTRLVTEFTVVLTSAEVHELAFYLSGRGVDSQGNGVAITNGIHDAIHLALHPKKGNGVAITNGIHDAIHLALHSKKGDGYPF